jgi:hypothetical protein
MVLRVVPTGIVCARRRASTACRRARRYWHLSEQVDLAAHQSRVAAYLAQLPENYSQGAAYDRYVSARERTVDFLLTVAPDAKSLLTASQRRKLPPQVSNYLDERVLRFLRSSTAGDNSSVIIH